MSPLPEYLRIIREKYVDPKRVKPKEMLLSSLNAVQRDVAQVLAEPTMRERIAAKVTRPLRGLRIACYYGCLLTRPRGEEVSLRDSR